MKRYLSAVILSLMVVLLSACGQPSSQPTEPAQTVQASHAEIEAFCAPLAALTAAQLVELQPYPSDGEVTNEYALAYLYSVANQNFADRAAAYPELEGLPYTEFLDLSEDEVAQWLHMAFGDRFTVADLIPDQAMLVYNAHRYYIGRGEVTAVDTVCLEEGDVAWPSDAPYVLAYEYSAVLDAGVQTGPIAVTLEKLADGFSLKTVLIETYLYE